MGNRFLFAAILFFSVCSCEFVGRRERVADEPVAVLHDTVYPLGFCTDSFLVARGKVRAGETFSAFMNGFGVSADDSYRLLQASDSIFDARKFRAGNNWEAYFSADSSRLHYLVYEDSRVRGVVFSCADSLAAWPYQKDVQHDTLFADVTIHSSLWNDMIAGGASPLIIVELADIYAWTVDFFGLQEGDRFKIMYLQDEVDGEPYRITAVPYAVFERDGKVLPALYLDQGDGGNKYWNPEGESMKKAFLKAPLRFNRISSGFSYHRKHPVHGTVRPHTGVDYAAPSGTPVMSIGDGTVISKGYQGGGGHTVKIRHNSVYTTAYLHLSRYAAGVDVGTRVSQGQVIGYVGMSGTATGPHLDFRVWKNGFPINPLTMESPSGEPIRDEFRPALDSLYHLRDSVLRAALR